MSEMKQSYLAAKIILAAEIILFHFRCGSVQY